MRILQALGLVHREQQRGAQVHPRGSLVFVTQHDHRMLHRGAAGGIQRLQRRLLRRHQRDLAFVACGAGDEEVALAVHRAEARLLDLEQPIGQFGDAARIAIIGPQDLQRLPLGHITCQALPKQALHRRPREEVGVHDLVRIAAQQELPGALEAGQHQRQLHWCEILHLVDDDEVIHRPGPGQPGVRDQVQVEQPRLRQPLPIAAEERVRRLARAHRQQGLARTQRQVVGQAQGTTRLRADDAAKLLEQGMGIEATQGPGRSAVALEPGAEGGEAHFPPRRHLQRLEKLAVAEKVDLLRRILITVGVVQSARGLRQVGRQRDVEHPAFGFTQLGQRDGCLSGAGRADDDHRRRQPRHGVLRVVEHDRFVEQFELCSARVQPVQRQAIERRDRGGIGRGLALDLGFVHRRAAQEAGALVGVVLDHLQRQAYRLAADAGELQQQPVGIVELGPVEGAGMQLLHISAAEVARLDSGAHLVESRAHAAQVKVFVLEQAHGVGIR